MSDAPVAREGADWYPQSDDGADLGVPAEIALRAVLGDEKAQEEAEGESHSPAEMRVIIESAPLTGFEEIDFGSGFGYEMSANSCAHAFLKTVEADPSILTRDRSFTEEEIAGQDDHMKEWMRTSQRGLEEIVYEAAKEKYPLSKLGLTGFQVGWAMNTVLYILDKPPVPNPAILTVNV